LPYINITFLFHSDSQLIYYCTYVCPTTGANIPSIQSPLNLVTSHPKVIKVVIIFTMNPQNGWAMEATTLPSPLPTRQLFSAGARSVDARTNPTRAAVTGQQSGSAIDNDCTTINIVTYNISDGRSFQSQSGS
jgi:hypothetical protein